MKKLSFITVLILLLCSMGTYAQLLSPVTSATYFMLSPDNMVKQTQKTLLYNDSHRITLTQTNDRLYRFYHIVQGTSNEKYVSIPDGFQVTDFDILGDTLYFSGYRTTGDTATSLCYIGYYNIQDAIFNYHPNIVYTPISELPSNKSDLRKIRAYYDAEGTPVIAGIGTMYFAEPKKQMVAWNGVNTYTYWEYYPYNYYDYLMVYKVTEEMLATNEEDPAYLTSPIYATGNILQFYHTPLVNDTVYNDNAEHLEDITITDDYICTVSITNTGTTGWQYENTSNNNRFVVRTMDKDDSSMQKTYYFNVADLGYSPFDGSVFIRSIGKNDISLGYMRRYYNQNARIVIDKINTDDAPFSIYWSAISGDSFAKEKRIVDMQYNRNENDLLLLTYQYRPDNNIYKISADSNLPLPGNNKKYNLDFGTGYEETIIWNNLLVDNNNYATATGYRPYSLMYFDRNMLINQDSECDYISEVTWNRGSERFYEGMRNLIPCKFSRAVPYDMGGGGVGAAWINKTQCKAFINLIVGSASYNDINYRCLTK